jgi:hypothetical protein
MQALQLSSTKDLILELPLTARVRELTVVNILAPSVRRVQNRFYVTTEEETRRLPATFFDPARTAASFPGVHLANDQANGMVIHGLSPALLQWNIEGVPVLNPNHLANAGTWSDRATLTAGGVNMLSNQVLSTSKLVTGALPPRYGDAVSGVMDLTVRQGNDRKHEHTFQAGLLGLEGASEGPLSGNTASYLVNYRYSFVGLLTGLGIDFGDERISFQDLNFNIHIPLSGPGSYVKIFGVGGLNTTDLDGPRPPDEREDSRDISRVDYDAGTVISGAALQWPTRKGVIRASAALSYARSLREEDRVVGQETLSMYAFERMKHAQIASRLEWQSPRSGRITLNLGMGLTHQWINGIADFPEASLYYTRGNSLLLRPYGELSYVLTGDLVVRGGLAVTYLTGERGVAEESGSRVVPEPSLHLYWQASEKVSVESGFSFSGMATPYATYLYREGSPGDPDFVPDLLRSRTFSFIVRNQIRSGTQLAAIIQYYALSHVPMITVHGDAFTILGDLGYPHDERLSPEGKGKAISLALAARQEMRNGMFGRAGIGWVHATHQGASGLSFSTPYDIGPWAVVSGGKEWEITRDYGRRILGVNGALRWNNGMRDQVIDLNASRKAGYTRFQLEGDFSQALEDYYRMDLRLYLRKEKAHRTTTWSLDIQNLTSRENAFFSLYDPVLDDIRQLMQLGVVPVLSYRVDF